MNPNPSVCAWQQRHVRDHARKSGAYASFNLIGVNYRTVELLLRLQGSKLENCVRDEYLSGAGAVLTLSQKPAVHAAPRGNVSHQFDTSMSSEKRSDTTLRAIHRCTA